MERAIALLERDMSSEARAKLAKILPLASSTDPKADLAKPAQLISREPSFEMRVELAKIFATLDEAYQSEVESSRGSESSPTCESTPEVESSPATESSPEPELDEDYQTYRHVFEPPLSANPVEIGSVIESTSIKRLQDLVHLLAETQPEARKVIESKLLQFVRGRLDTKRKRYETCKNCNEEYHVNFNYKRSCVYHEDHATDVDEDWEGWREYEYLRHGNQWALVDSPYWRDGFKWRCCWQEPDAPGCIVSKHVPKDEPAVKRRALGPLTSNNATP